MKDLAIKKNIWYDIRYGILQKLNVTNKKFHLNSNLARGVKFRYFEADFICGWSPTNKNEHYKKMKFSIKDFFSKCDQIRIFCEVELEFTLDDSNSWRD